MLTDKYTLLSKSGDNCFQIADDIVLIENTVRLSEDTHIIFRKFNKKQSYGQYPFPLANIGIYRVWGLSDKVSVSNLQSVAAKNIYFTLTINTPSPSPSYTQIKGAQMLKSVHNK